MAAVAPLAAQPPPRVERPYRGLFGGGVGNTEQLLTLTASLGAGYDDNVLADATGRGGSTADPRAAQSGTFGQFAGDVSYGLDRTRVSFSASAATSSRYFPDLPAKFLGTHSGSVGTSLQLAEGTRVMANHTTTYQPFQTLDLFPRLFETSFGQAQPGRQELSARLEDYLTHSSSVELTQRISRRSALVFSYAYRLSDFQERDGDFTTQSAGGRFTLGLMRGLGLRLGYAYSDGQYARLVDTRVVRGHNLDVGVDFNRALSFSRRTTLSFGTGSAAIVDRDRTYYRVTGNARLNREIGRTWNASLAYNRGVGFVETFSEPLFSDSLTVGVGGMVNRRLQITSSIASSVGDVGLSGNGNGFDTYTGTVGVNFGLTRYMGLGVNYSYYRYSFESGVFLPAGFSREMDRQSVQAHLRVWVPLVHRARRPDASR